MEEIQWRKVREDEWDGMPNIPRAMSSRPNVDSERSRQSG